MQSDPEIEAIVLAMSSDPDDPKRDSYRKLAIQARDRFNALIEDLETEADAAEMMRASSSSLEAERSARTHQIKAQEILIELLPLASRLAIGGNNTYQERVDELSARLRQMDSKGKGGGCLGTLTIGLLLPVAAWLVSHYA